jgi:hypothetical protein
VARYRGYLLAERGLEVKTCGYLNLVRLLTATHGAEDGAIDGAHVAAASVGIVARARQCAEHPCGPQTGGPQCCRAASAPRRCAPDKRCGSTCHRIPGKSVQHAAHNVVTVTAPIGSSPRVIHSSSPWSATRHLHREWRSTVWPFIARYADTVGESLGG